MRQRDRKKMVDRQSLASIHIGRFIDELSQALEDAYRKSLEEENDAAGDTTAQAKDTEVAS
ncbi:hypothetical protein [Noviherbaspirillum pedocola]|uniref:Uncharacterized protein n=1 Tax=Noviherbaspirillum pedocola TaxID=2801341 RepID=A0A934STS6_9BURK|nr:hypothetical protein [Noviherbaspirillum pedocola]MBK4735305.1 hypothetical protein [Noviherbaspirillum pedocola]